MGKTFIVKQAFARMGFMRCYMPVPGSFFFGDYGTGAYDHIEFENYSRCYPQIKHLLDRVSFSVDRKNRNPQNIKALVPIVFISNNEPYCDRAFLRRLEVV
jgi:hypothetical protein